MVWFYSQNECDIEENEQSDKKCIINLVFFFFLLLCLLGYIRIVVWGIPKQYVYQVTQHKGGYGDGSFLFHTYKTSKLKKKK